MTAKRFTLFEDLDIKDEATGKIYPPCLDRGLTRLVDLLNQLNDENESLKEENKFLRNKVATYKKGNALLKSTMDKEWK